MKFLNAALPALCTLALAAASLSPANAQTYTSLYNFTGGAHGANPSPAAPLALDSAGTLYGSAQLGGIPSTACPAAGCGTLFKLTPAGRLIALHQFAADPDAGDPLTGVTLFHGKLYGTANGGPRKAGIIFSLDLDGSHYQVLHAFTGKDGTSPAGQLQPAPNGGFFGVTTQGGRGVNPANPRSAWGVIFYIRPDGVLSVLHNFDQADGSGPTALLTDGAGNLFGTTVAGGQGCGSSRGCGVVFEFSTVTHAYTVLHAFTDGSDGTGPYLGSIGADGTLYGATTTYSRPFGYRGLIFALAPRHGAYAFSVLTQLVSPGIPTSGPTLAPNGDLVGAYGRYVYFYRPGGHPTNLVSQPPLNYFNQPIVSAAGVIYGTGEFGGIAPCFARTSHPDLNGCGGIYSYARIH